METERNKREACRKWKEMSRRSRGIYMGDPLTSRGIHSPPPPFGRKRR